MKKEKKLSSNVVRPSRLDLSIAFNGVEDIVPQAAPAETKKVKSQQKGATKAKREIKNVKRASVDSHGDIVPVDATQFVQKNVSVALVAKNASSNFTVNVTRNATPAQRNIDINYAKATKNHNYKTINALNL